MTIDELAKSKSNAEPNCLLVKYFEAAIPQYHIQAVFTMLKKKQLSVLQEFILKFCSNGVSDISEIASFLGIKITTVNDAVALLQKSEMISVDIFSSRIKLLDKGTSALREAVAIVPEDVEYPIFVDGILGEIYFSIKSQYTKEQVQKFGFKSIIPDIDLPTPEYLEFQKVKNAMAAFRNRYDYERDYLEGDFQEISRIEKSYLEYKKVSVLVYMNRKTSEIRFVVYEGTTRNDEYGIALQRMYDQDIHLFDFDIKSPADENEERPLLNLVPPEVIANATEYSAGEVAREQALRTYRQQLVEMTAQDDESFDDEEENIAVGSQDKHETATERIRFLESKIAELESEAKSTDRVLSTYDHRPLLKRALVEAKSSVIIISPWIKAGAMDNEVINMITNAVRRKIKITIGYGISEQTDSDQWVVKKLKKIADDNKPFFNLIPLNNTHEKVLIMDNTFMVITSFNWLSFKGDPKRGFRQETGYYTESKEAINQMKTNLSSPQRLNIRC